MVKLEIIIFISNFLLISCRFAKIFDDMIRYSCEDIKFRFTGRRAASYWLKKVALEEGRLIGDINVVFCSDSYILDMNRKYLNHDYFTDIITFDYCVGDILSGDLFISVETVKDNSAFYGVSFEEELFRVIVHGVLHLIGYDDHSEEDKKTMRLKENFYLKLREKLSL